MLIYNRYLLEMKGMSYPGRAKDRALKLFYFDSENDFFIMRPSTVNMRPNHSKSCCKKQDL